MYKSRKTTSRSHHKKQSVKPFLLIVSLFVVMTSVAAYVLYQYRDNNSDTPAETDKSANYINLDPPTQQDIEEAEKNKEAVSESIDNNTTEKEEKNQASIIITYAGQYSDFVEAASYVQGIFEEGGTCTYSFTKDASEVLRTTNSVANVSDTLCPAISIPKNEFSASGSWRLIVSYESETTKAVSNATPVEIQ